MTRILSATWDRQNIPDPETLRELKIFCVAAPANVLVPLEGEWWFVTKIDVAGLDVHVDAEVTHVRHEDKMGMWTRYSELLQSIGMLPPDPIVIRVEVLR